MPSLLQTLAALACALATPAAADVYAYEGGGNSEFGVIDMTTGVFTACGTSATLLSGLGIGPHSHLYGGAFNTNTLYTIDPTNGVLTAIGTSKMTYWDTGSTTTGVYAVGTDSNLYAINTATAAATLIGPTGISSNLGGYYGLSTNAKSLYYSHAGNLYQLDLKTGAGTAIGGASAGIYGAEVFEGGKLYAGSQTPFSVYTLDTTTGASTFVSNVTGPASTFWGLVPIKATHISKAKICALHKL